VSAVPRDIQEVPRENIELGNVHSDRRNQVQLSTHDVRGCLLAAKMILGYSYEMHTYPVICITPMHVLLKWSATCSLAGVHVGRAKQGRFVHTWILCNTDLVITSGSR
jgi:hypothetical protein